ETIFLGSLGSTLHDHHAARKIIGISRRVWDADTKTLHVESDELLDQHSRYVLIVTDGIRDAFGDRVEAGEFARFRHDLRFDHRGRDHRREGRSAEDSRDAFGAPVDSGDFVRVSRDVDFDDHRDLDNRDRSLKDYREALRHALRYAIAASHVPQNRVVVASLFTTQSVTAVLEKIRHRLKTAFPNPADFVIASTQATPGSLLRAVFPFSDVRSMQFTRQGIRVTASQPLTVEIRVADFLQNSPQVVGHIAFGKFASYEYRTVAPTIDTIPATGTRTRVPEATETTDVYFNLILPVARINSLAPGCQKPDAGWPVAIFGHGLAGDKNVDVAAAARVLAAHCIATIGMNSPGHGFGAGGTLTVNLSGGSVTVPSGGRGIDQNGDGVIDATEGLFAASPSSLISIRDGIRQAVIDLMQLVRVIEVGMDADGDG